MDRESRGAALVMYYSFTGAVETGAVHAAETLRSEGYDVTLAAVDFAEETVRFPLEPFWSKFWELNARSQAAEIVNVRVEPAAAGLLAVDWNLIVIGSPTWSMRPALPVTGFLASDLGRELLADRPFGAFAVARALWVNNIAVVRDMGESAGGRWLGGAGFTFPGSTVQTFASFFERHLHGTSQAGRLFGCRVTPFGPATGWLDKLAIFVRRLGAMERGDRQTELAPM